MKDYPIKEDSVIEPFELITIAEFDRRIRLARPWVFTITVLLPSLFLLGLFSLPIIAAKSPHDKTPSTYLILVLTFIIIFPFLVCICMEYICRRFRMCCPCCKKTLHREFKSFRYYIRSKGKHIIDSNPFISGQCRKCKKVVIEVDDELNRCLRDRNAQIKATSGSPISLICFLIGFVAFSFTITGIDTHGSNEQQPENMDIYSAKRQIGEGDFQQAKKTLAYILAKQPNYSTANQMLGYIYLQQDELEKALHRYQKALPYSIETDEVNGAISLINKRLKDE